MSGRTIRILAVAVVVLFAAVWLLNRQRGADTMTDELLFPGLEARLDQVTEVRISDRDSDIRIVREDDRWIVPEKSGYPADTRVLRELLLGIAEARKIEQKTSNSELYDRLGVQDPQDEDATGVLVRSIGLGDADFALILGDAAQRDYRYVRIPDEATSWLVDRNPEVPNDVAGWLGSDIVDLPASRVQSVTIEHADGETIRLRKEGEADTNFTVENIPEGRELSYASVANSIAAALDNLTLEDVRPGGAEPPAEGAGTKAATSVFRTFDGLEVTVESTSADDATWIRVQAAALPQDEAAPAGDGGDADQPAADEQPQDAPAPSAQNATADESPAGEDAGGATAETDAAETDAPEDEAIDPGAEAAGIEARVAGWEYRIPGYKASQLRRRWEDLLSDAGTGGE